MQQAIQFSLNGKDVSVKGGPGRNLLWVLRVDFGLTGAKYGCGEGLCGACTVLVDGKAIRSCHTPVEQVAGKKVVTIEGLARGEELHPVQKAFVKHDALQCGYCTPGMILTAAALLKKNPAPTRKQIVAGMEGNLCRCGAHSRIIQAIEEVAHHGASGTRGVSHE